MGKRSGEVGLCRLCLTHKLLTFEHYPPRAAGNIFPVSSSKTPKSNGFPGPGKLWQGGYGDYVLCEECNNGLMANRARHYGEWAQSARRTLVDAQLEEIERGLLEKRLIMRTSPSESVWPGRFARAVLGIFLVSQEPSVFDNHAEIYALLQSENRCDVPNSWRLSMYGAWGLKARFRSAPYMDLKSPGRRSTVLEATFLPFSFTLQLGDATEMNQHGIDITRYLSLGHHDKESIDIELPVFAVDDSHIPLGLRRPNWYMDE